MNNFRTGLMVLILVALVFCFSDLLFVRAQEAQTGPSGEAAEGKPEPLREDTRLINVKGKIMDLKSDLKKSDYSRSAFVPKNGPGHFILLENRNLEEIEQITRHGEKEVIVSGTVTAYKGKNYLLLTRYSAKGE